MLRIVFFGTPYFAVPCLKILVDNGYSVVAVVTSPDKPAGRGLQPAKSDVKIYAESLNIPVLQPASLKDENFIAELSQFKADVHIVVAFRMLPEKVWNMPPLGTYNVHASLLPDYRGAAPINWALMNGETKTGVTTFKLKHAIDTGNILFQKEVEISPEMTAGELHDVLMMEGAELLLRSVRALELGEIVLREQEPLPTQHHAPKLYKENCRIDWSKPAQEIHHHIRGLSPYPAAWAILIDENGREVQLKIFKSKVVSNDGVHTDFLLHTDRNGSLFVCCGKGKIQILELQAAGKKRMNSVDFLRGFRLTEGCKLK